MKSTGSAESAENPKRASVSRRFRFVLFSSLYLSQVLPYGFFMQALPVLLRKSGSSLSVVGASSLLALPWGVKFLWAPLVDRLGFANIGLRRSWILVTQSLSILLFLAVSQFDPAENLIVVMVMVLLANLLAATQDIATDALAIDSLASSQRAWAGGIKVGAYRIGMIIGGGVILQFANALKWDGLMWMLALITLICSLPIARFHEDLRLFQLKRKSVKSYGDALHDYSQFFKNKGIWAWFSIIATFKMSHYAASEMIRPWLVDQGYSLSEIATVLSTAGFAAGFAGAVYGGWLASRVDRKSWLAPLGFIQMLGVSSYLLPIKTNARHDHFSLHPSIFAPRGCAATSEPKLAA